MTALTTADAPAQRYEDGEYVALTDAEKAQWVTDHTPSKADLLAYAASVRWAKETGGITVAGAQVDTLRESQTMIGNANQLLEASGASTIDYKTKSGWVTLSAEQFKALALAVGGHVIECFSAEKAISAQIAAGTVTTRDQIDAAFMSS